MVEGTLKRVLSIQRRKKERATLLQRQLINAYPTVDYPEEPCVDSTTLTASTEWADSIEQPSPILSPSPLIFPAPATSQDLLRPRVPTALTPTVSHISLEEMSYDFRSFLPTQLVYVGPIVRRTPASGGERSRGRVGGMVSEEVRARRKSWKSAESGRFTSLDGVDLDLTDGRIGMQVDTRAVPFPRPTSSPSLVPSRVNTPSTRPSTRGSGHYISSTYSAPSLRDEISFDEMIRSSSKLSDCTSTTSAGGTEDDEVDSSEVGGEMSEE